MIDAISGWYSLRYPHVRGLKHRCNMWNPESLKSKSLRIASVFIQPLWQVLPVLTGCAIWAWANVGFEGMLKHENDSIDRILDSQIPKSKSPDNPQAIVGWSKCCACAKAPGPSRDPRTPPKRTADTALAGFEGSNLRNSMVFLDYFGFAKKWDLTIKNHQEPSRTIKNHQEPSRTGISRIWLWQWGN